MNIQAMHFFTVLSDKLTVVLGKGTGKLFTQKSQITYMSHTAQSLSVANRFFFIKYKLHIHLSNICTGANLMKKKKNSAT